MKKSLKQESVMRNENQGGAMKLVLFGTGLASGVVLTHFWRVLVKEGIKLGMQAGVRLNQISQKAREEIEDVAAEANAELAHEGPTANGRTNGGG